jgi:hypothetical protein
MNSSSENFDSVFNSLESFENMNAPLTENFSWIKPVARPTFCEGVYCGIPQEKAFAKYENRNFTSVQSDYGFNQPTYNQKSYMKFKSGASKLQNFDIPVDKNRGYSTTESPSNFSDLEPIKGLYRDVTTNGAIKSSSYISSKGLSSPASEYTDFRTSTSKPSTARVTHSSAKTVSTKPSVATSIVKSIFFPTSSVPTISSVATKSSASTKSSVPKTSSSKVSSVVTTSYAPKTSSSKASSSKASSSTVSSSKASPSSSSKVSSSKVSTTVSTKSSKK